MKFFAIPDLPAPRIHLAVRDWAVGLVIFALSAGIFLRHNDFPSFYHPDEPSKARQVIEGEYNFNHPLLLLQATRVIALAEGVEMRQQSVTEAGRTASALFAAGAVACLTLLAAHLRGTWAAAGVGLLLASNRHLYELAHYMKEDPALAFGVAVFFLMLARSWLAPTGVNFFLLGAGAALATSGKYLGAVVIPLALLPIFLGSREGRLRNGLIYLAGLAAVLVAVNFPMLGALGELTTNVEREAGYAVGGHKGLTRSVPHGVYGAVFREATNPLIWVLLGIYYGGLILRWRKTHPAEKTLALFPLVYVLMLSFSPKTHHRYFLPDTLLFCTLAGMAMLPEAGRLTRQAAKWLTAALVAGAIVWSVCQAAETDASFQNDARRALVAYVREHIPADAVIVQDKRVNLPSRDDPRQADSPYFLDQKLLGKLFAADEGTVDELKARGIRYVAVAEGDYGRFFLKTHRPQEAGRDDYERRKAFYKQLFAEGQVLWECPAGPQQYLQPAIKLYQLPPGN